MGYTHYNGFLVGIHMFSVIDILITQAYVYFSVFSGTEISAC